MGRSPLKRFGSYALLSRLAKGGMGEVYIARHGELRGMQKLCVVKTLRADMSQDKEYAARFFDEARLVVQLSHRNICQVFDVGRVGDRFYLGMELVGGLDLRALIDDARRRKAGVPEPIALFIASEMLEALSYAHRRTDPQTGASLRIVHRDVSPQNVMVSFEGEVKLIDFGLAASTMKQERTQVNRVMGKLHYMSPEQAHGGDVDERADIFAAAVVTYELLTGQRYYEGMSHDEVWNVAGRGTYKAPKLSSLHKGLARVLEGALAAKPKDRTATAEGFRDAIESYLFARGFRPSPADLRAYLAEHLDDEAKKHGATMAELGGGDASDDVPIEESRSLFASPTPTPVRPTDATVVSSRVSVEDSHIQTTSGKAQSADRGEPQSDDVVDARAIPDAHVAVEEQSAAPTTSAPPVVVEPKRGEAPPLSRAARIALGAAASLAALLLITAVALLAESDAPEEPTSVDAPVVATRDAPPVETPDEPAPVVDAGADRATNAESVAKAAPKTRKRPSTKRGPRAPARTASAETKLSFLKANCLDVTCTATVLAMKPKASWSQQERFRYDNVLSSCVALCAE